MDGNDDGSCKGHRDKHDNLWNLWPLAAAQVLKLSVQGARKSQIKTGILAMVFKGHVYGFLVLGDPLFPSLPTPEAINGGFSVATMLLSVPCLWLVLLIL